MSDTSAPQPEGARAPSGAKGSRSQTLDRGLAVLDLVASASHGLTVTEIAATIGAHRTIVTRLLNTLADRRYVTRDGSGRYVLGSYPLELSRYVQPRIRTVAQPILQRLADLVGATTHLTVAEGDQAVALMVIEPRTATFHVSYRVGTRRPLSRGASGIAILSARPPAPAESPETAQARRQGWALSRGHLESGTMGVAAPIPHPQYPDASVGVVRLSDAEPEPIARAVLDAASEIAESLR